MSGKEKYELSLVSLKNTEAVELSVGSQIVGASLGHDGSVQLMLAKRPKQFSDDCRKLVLSLCWADPTNKIKLFPRNLSVHLATIFEEEYGTLHYVFLSYDDDLPRSNQCVIKHDLKKQGPYTIE